MGRTLDALNAIATLLTTNNAVQAAEFALDAPKTVTVTFTVDAGVAYANGDLVADLTEIAAALKQTGDGAVLDSIALIDEDDNTAAVYEVIIGSAAGSLGSLNGAPAPTDAVARTVLSSIPVASADFRDYANSKVAVVKNIGLVIDAAATSLYAAVVVTTGTPTFTASGLKATFGFRYK